MFAAAAHTMAMCYDAFMQLHACAYNITHIYLLSRRACDGTDAAGPGVLAPLRMKANARGGSS